MCRIIVSTNYSGMVLNNTLSDIDLPSFSATGQLNWVVEGLYLTIIIETRF